VTTQHLLIAAVALVAGASALIVALRMQPGTIVTIGLMLGVFSGNWDHLGLPIGIDRLFVLGGIGLALIRWKRDGWVGLRFDGVGLLMATLVGYAVVSAVWAGDLTDKRPAFALADALGLLPFALFLMAPALFRTEQERRVLLGGLVALGAYLGLIATFETAHLYSLVFPKYINDPSIGIHVDRARGPFTEASANGGAMIVCLVACAMAFTTWRSSAARVTALGVAALCAVGIVGTVTREVWLAAALAALVPLAVFRPLRRFLVPVTVAGALVVVGSLAVVPGLSNQVHQRASYNRSLWDRLNSNRAAVNMIEARPALGFGWGQFGANSPTYYTTAADYPVTGVGQLHNLALTIGTELGLVGLALWISILLLAFGRALTRRGPPELEPWRIGLLPVIIGFLVISNFAPVTYPFANYLVWAWAGIVYFGLPATATAAAARPVLAPARPPLGPQAQPTG
jgi:putative inorganic carbon (hco3(-)) transporter